MEQQELIGSCAGGQVSRTGRTQPLRAGLHLVARLQSLAADSPSCSDRVDWAVRRMFRFGCPSGRVALISSSRTASSARSAVLTGAQILFSFATLRRRTTRAG